MDSKSLAKHKKLLLEFIEMYRSMPCLWERQHQDYALRQRRLEAYKALMHKYREIDADATLPTVKSRLDIIRNGYIRELKKVRLSKEMSSDPAKHYMPRLWYYDSCSFLEDQYLPAKEPNISNTSESNYDNEEEIEFRKEYNDTQTECLEESSCSSLGGEPSHKRRKELVVKSERNKDSPNKHSNEDLECMGKAIALQMRNLDPYQSAIANKLISDAIFYAKLGKLTVDSQIFVKLREDEDADYS